MGNTGSERRNRILVVDDESKLRAMLRMILENRGYEVLEAADGREAVTQAMNAKPDLVILDVMMPVMDGIDCCREIRQFSDCPIIMLTAKGEDYDQVSGLESGADDYVVKPFSTSVLIARVEAALRRSAGIATSTLIAGAVTIDTQSREVRLNGETVELNRKEFDLFYYLCENRDMVLSRTQILENVWGYDYLGSESTVDTHMNRLRKKLGEYGSMVKTVRGVGYRFEVDDEE